MRLSVIIPVLNEAGQAAAAMTPLQAARRRGHEIIVVDGGSEDDSMAEFTPWADALINVGQAGRGRARQMNAGAALASGDALVFLHADTVLMPDFDRLISAALQQSAWGFFLVRLSDQHFLLRLIAAGINKRSALTACATGDQCLFMRRAIFDALGGYADIALMEDLELSDRLRGIGRPAVIRHKAITSSRRWERGGILRTMLRMWWLRASWRLGRDPALLARRYG